MTKNKHPRGGSYNIISRIRKYFPEVNEVKDARKSITVEVLPKDNLGKKRSPQACALARACERHFGADGAIINIGFSYIIHGQTAVRFVTTQAIGREITSFDRSGFFAGGRYTLGKISPSLRLGSKPSPKPTGPHLKASKDKPIIHRHRTTHIRVSGNGIH